MKAAEIYTHTRGCLCKIILSIIAIAIITPTYAKDSNNHIEPSPTNDCVESTLGTATGPANLEADWTANTINLEWYNEDTKLTVPTTSNTCTYDGGITLPSTNPTKTGYTFKGWRVRAAAANVIQTLFGNLNVGINAVDSSYHYVMSPFGVEFNYGTVYGESSCNSITPETDEYGMYVLASSDAMNTSSSGVKCWCRVTGLQVNGGDRETDNSLKWRYRTYYSNTSQCDAYCASDCSYGVRASSLERARMYGQIKYTTNCEAINTEINCASTFNTDDYSMCFWNNGSCHNKSFADCDSITNETICNEHSDTGCAWSSSGKGYCYVDIYSISDEGTCINRGGGWCGGCQDRREPC